MALAEDTDLGLNELVENPLLDALCATCSRLFDDSTDWTSDSAVQAHHHVKVLRQSVAAGCHLCVLLLRAIDGVEQPNRKSRWPDDVRKIVESDDYQVWISIHKEPGPGWNSWNFRLSIYPCNLYLGYGGNSLMAELPISSIARRRPPPGYIEEGPGMAVNRRILQATSCQEVIDQIELWIDNCSSSHDRCRLEEAGYRAKQLPTRLLGFDAASNMQVVRLIETRTMSDSITYMTLSHCWGGHLSLKLTRQTQEMFKSGISVSALPRTFQDAIQLAHKLGTKYLWIDALCIIQDSSEDWRKEASRMASVYAHSALNIMAMAAGNSNEGLFRKRNPLAVVPCKVRATWTCYKAREFYIAPNLGSIEKDCCLPLNQRGWVLQERLLSGRTIAFGQQQVYWTCRTRRASETFPEGELLPESHLRARLRDVPSQPMPQYQKSDIVQTWMHLVEEYTQLRLTFESDKLVAISGLARKMQATSRGLLGQYYAGIWKYSMAAQLAWRTVGPYYGSVQPNSVAEIRSSRIVQCEKLPESPQYIAPSWSWASASRPVDHRGLTEPLLQVCNVFTETIQDEYGAVRHGSLKVRAFICQARISYDEFTWQKVTKLTGDMSAEIKDLSYWWSQSCPAMAQYNINDLPHDIDTWLMPLGSRWSDSGVGLVLLPATNYDGPFRRVGLFDWNRKEELSLIMKSSGGLSVFEIV